MLISKLPKDIIRLLLFKYICPSDLNNVIKAASLEESTVFQEPIYTLKNLIARQFAYTFYMNQAESRLFQIARAKGKSIDGLKFSERQMWNSLAQCNYCGTLVKKRNLKKHCKNMFHVFIMCSRVEIYGKEIYVPKQEKCQKCLSSSHQWEQWKHADDCLWKSFDPNGGPPRCKDQSRRTRRIRYF